MKMKKVGEYGADKGTFVLNGIGFSNGFGDGSFDITLMERNTTERFTEKMFAGLTSEIQQKTLATLTINMIVRIKLKN